MTSVLTIIICTTVVLLLVIVIIRKQLHIKNNELSKLISQSAYVQAKDDILRDNKNTFVDIPTDIDKAFHGKVISESQQKELVDYYAFYFQKAYSLVRMLKTFGIIPSVIISSFINDFGKINKFIKQHNERIMNLLLDTHQSYFDHCLKYPLDKQQRRSIVSEAENCLVVSSAGSGKTSSIVGKVKYLTEIKGIAPERILLISYTNKAAAELTERMATKGLKGYTFHKLAIDIIAKTTGIKPSICDNTDALFINIYRRLSEKLSFKKCIIQYFADYQTNEADWEIRKNERRELLSEQKNGQLKAMFPDMDGNTICVRSEQEQKICFALSSLGIKYRYEEPYE